MGSSKHAPTESLSRPRSVNTIWVSLLGVAGFLLAAFKLYPLDMARAEFTMWCMAATAGPMILADLALRRVHRRPSTGLVWDRRGSSGLDPLRVLVKLLGLALTLGTLAVIYTVAPEYSRSFYRPCRDALELAGPWLVPVVVIYFAFVDSRMKEPRDGYWLLGALLLRLVRFRNLDSEQRHDLKHHALGWAIKGFYLPLMFVYLSNAASKLAAWPLDRIFGSMIQFVFFSSQLALAIDLAFVVVGYSLTMRLIDSHIRTGNPFMYGWVFTLMLYAPFWSRVSDRYFKYSDGNQWYEWMGDYSALIWIWGAGIVVTRIGWAWANLSFGCRFSNLTHRGIITNGPYRYTKHPSYIFKNLSWWMLSVPFLATGGLSVAWKTSLMLLGVNALYFARSRAEEQHLSEDPVYVQYAEWMNEHGALAWFGRMFPVFRYRPPADAGHRSHGQELA